MVRKSIYLSVLVILGILMGVSFIFSSHTTYPNSVTIFTVNVSSYNIFNITINNSNTNSDTGNFTEVNITLPSVFSFVANTNRTSLTITHNFTNTSTTLSWANASRGSLIGAGDNNTYFWFNATPSTTGVYNFTIISSNVSGGVYRSNISVRVLDTSAPVITLISPTNGNITVTTSTRYSYNVTDSSSFNKTNCTMILNGVVVYFNTSVNTAGVTTSFTNVTYNADGNVWVVNCTDSDNNRGTATANFSLASFPFNGTVKDEGGNSLNNSIINITIRNQAGFSVVGYAAGTSNASGWFNFNVSSNASWIYGASILHKNASNGNIVDSISKTMPAFPSAMMPMLAGTVFYLTPAGTINLTAINASGVGNISTFQYQIKDSKLGYPIAEEHSSFVSQAVVYVPRNRNYSIMIYPYQSMPLSFDWNNFTSPSNYTFGINRISNYNAANYTLNKQFNTTMTMTRVSGYLVNGSGHNINGTFIITNFTVIPYLLEPGNMIHSEYGDMPYNLSTAVGQSDHFNLTNGFFNISLPATTESSSLLLFASALNGTGRYYGGFKNITLTYGTLSNITNITVYGLLGSETNITLDRMDGDGTSIGIPVAKQTFIIVNVSNYSLASTSAHVETTVDYTSYGALEFTWMTDVAQSQAFANFSLPLLNVTGIKEMNVYASGGPSGSNGQYAPKRVGTMTASDITSNSNITIKTFSPGAIDGSVGASSININLYISNSSCDIPNPADSCILGSSATMSDFNPMRAVMGGGKLSFRMGSGGILIHYVNVDLLASGPPDGLFENDAGTSEASASFKNIVKFGSQGPTMYDYVLVSIPYVEGAGSTTGLKESDTNFNVSIPVFYDDNWNIIWNVTANGTNTLPFAGNYSHYSTYRTAWANLTIQKVCSRTAITSSNTLSETDPCYIDITNNRVWIRLPHFSGTGPDLEGEIVTANSTSTSSSSGGGSSTVLSYWTSTHSITDSQFKEGYTKDMYQKYRVQFKIGSDTHYVGVVGLTSTTATINISSTPQQAVFNIGDEKKFDVNDDSYYDVYVKLNSITETKASVTIKSIHEKIPAAVVPQEEDKSITDTIQDTGEQIKEEIQEDLSSNKSIVWTWTIIIILIIVIIIVILFSLMKKGKKGREKYF